MYTLHATILWFCVYSFMKSLAYSLDISAVSGSGSSPQLSSVQKALSMVNLHDVQSPPGAVGFDSSDTPSPAKLKVGAQVRLHRTMDHLRCACYTVVFFYFDVMHIFVWAAFSILWHIGHVSWIKSVPWGGRGSEQMWTQNTAGCSCLDHLDHFRESHFFSVIIAIICCKTFML